MIRRYAAKLSYLDAEDGEWREIEATDWLGVWACNVPYMTETDFAAPEAEFDNGVLDTLCLAGTSRLQALKMFLAIEDGTHLGGKGLTLLKARGFRLEPLARTKKRPGLLDVDGEEVPFGPCIEARAHKGALRVLV